jgi:hypothetical protein
MHGCPSDHPRAVIDVQFTIRSLDQHNLHFHCLAGFSVE